jgi:NAD(P)-dependent dehydrogenase (short-subunit alcohol dehydrogenase family)
MEGNYSGITAYGQSKLALNHFTYGLAQRLEGTGVTANAMHPGFVATHIYRDYALMQKVVLPLLRVFIRSPEEGAETVIYLASSAEVTGVSGAYWRDNDIVRSPPGTDDQATQHRVWSVAMRMTGLETQVRPGAAVAS